MDFPRDETPIKSSQELAALLKCIKGCLSTGALAQVYPASAPTNDIRVIPDAPPWPDYIEAHFVDTDANRYALNVETYHWSGGQWRPTGARPESVSSRDVAQLVRQLTDAVRPWLPSHFAIETQDDTLTLTSPEGEASVVFGYHLRMRLELTNPFEAAAEAIVRTLEDLQEEVTQLLKWPWPPVEGDRSAFQEPFYKPLERSVFFGYGSPDGPMTATVTIPWK